VALNDIPVNEHDVAALEVRGNAYMIAAGDSASDGKNAPTQTTRVSKSIRSICWFSYMRLELRGGQLRALLRPQSVSRCQPCILQRNKTNDERLRPW